MIGITLDVTTDFNANNTAVIDAGGFENVIIQMVGSSGIVLLQGSNDGGAVTGSIEDSPKTAINFTTIVATNMLDGTNTSSLATAGLYKIRQPCVYIKFGGAAAAATKVLVFMSKI